ncbi:hypothetical protein [Gemmatimonas sp.]|uniref:hypothetical protein n=1 Tax=Gemmatimonas sp. TaxID=1962908 RepID=UPI00333F59E4
MKTPTPTPRTDAATYPADCLGKTLVTNRDLACTLERELSAITAERDQLRGDCENETKWAAHYLAQSIADKARAERAEADAAAYLKRAESFSKLADEAEAELAAERARLDYLLRWHPTFNSREDIDRDMNGGAK